VRQQKQPQQLTATILCTKYVEIWGGCKHQQLSTPGAEMTDNYLQREPTLMINALLTDSVYSCAI
jgi:hypothetical protein